MDTLILKVIAVVLGLVDLCHSNNSTYCEKHIRNSEDDNCMLNHYRPADLVQCLDSFSAIPEFEGRQLHFAFVGDSRMRQQFYSFVQLFPNYDAQWEGEPTRQHMGHYDMDVTVPLLGAKVSFLWRPVDKGRVLAKMTEWSRDPRNAPIFILLGFGPHYMLPWNGEGFTSFEKDLRALKPIIHKLMESSHVVWFNQVPAVEFFGLISDHNTIVHSDKVEQYAQLARRELNDTGLPVWDSLLPLALDYIRSCEINDNRKDIMWFYHCFDYIHTGFVALHHSTQLLVNYVCSKIM